MFGLFRHGCLTQPFFNSMQTICQNKVQFVDGAVSVQTVSWTHFLYFPQKLSAITPSSGVVDRIISCTRCISSVQYQLLLRHCTKQKYSCPIFLRLFLILPSGLHKKQKKSSLFCAIFTWLNMACTSVINPTGTSKNCMRTPNNN